MLLPGRWLVAALLLGPGIPALRADTHSNAPPIIPPHGGSFTTPIQPLRLSALQAPTSAPTPASKPTSAVAATQAATEAAPSAPPPELAGKLGTFRSVLRFRDGRPVTTPAEWAERRKEILHDWHTLMGPWPPLLEKPELSVLSRQRRPGEAFEQRRVRVPITADRTTDGWLLVPDGPGPFPAVLVPYYEPETSIGLDKPLRDFALQLSRRGFVTLSIGSPGGDARRPDLGSATCQPLSYLAYIAANCATALANLPEVDGRRLGVVGHSYGGKWAMFAACLCERFAAGAWSDPGIVWDESRPNVNYWDVWYLGKEVGVPRSPGTPTASNPATGAYRALVAGGHDLHELMALMAPRPFLVSGGSEDPVDRWIALNHVVGVQTLLGQSGRVFMTTRPAHDPTEASNSQIYTFFQQALGRPATPEPSR